MAVFFIYQENTRISRTEFVYADDKRVHDRKCLLIEATETGAVTQRINKTLLVNGNLGSR